jgi:hypothetical protein
MHVSAVSNENVLRWSSERIPYYCMHGQLSGTCSVRPPPPPAWDSVVGKLSGMGIWVGKEGWGRGCFLPYLSHTFILILSLRECVTLFSDAVPLRHLLQQDKKKTKNSWPLRIKCSTSKLLFCECCAWVFIAPNSQSRQNRNVKNKNMSWMVSVKLKILLG